MRVAATRAAGLTPIRLQRRRLAERRRLRSVHVEIVEEDQARAFGRAGLDEIRHRARPGLAPQRADIGKADRQHDLGQSRDRRAHGVRVERVAAAECDARRQIRRRLALRDDDRASSGGEPLDGRRADRAVADDADLVAHVSLPRCAGTLRRAAGEGNAGSTRVSAVESAIPRRDDLFSAACVAIFRRVAGPHCYAFYAGEEEIAAMMNEEPGSFSVTDFLRVISIAW